MAGARRTLAAGGVADGRHVIHLAVAHPEDSNEGGLRRPALQHARPLPDGQPDPGAMYDGLRKYLLRLCQVIACIEQAIDLSAVTRPLLDFVEVVVIGIGRVVRLYMEFWVVGLRFFGHSERISSGTNAENSLMLLRQGSGAAPLVFFRNALMIFIGTPDRVLKCCPTPMRQLLIVVTWLSAG
jgi:hypothetical protein